MKKSIYFIAAAALVASCATADKQGPKNTINQEEVMSKMTLEDKAHRAIAGLSMGGFHSLFISINNPDMFGYVGLFSAAVDQQQSGQGGFPNIYADRNGKLDQLFSKNPKLFWIGCGKTDFLIKNNNDLRAYLDSKHHKYTYLETDGGHIWRNWRIYLSEFTPLLFK